MNIQTICVYCGSADKVHQEYLDSAYATGQALASASIQLVYGAGKTGLMGKVADGVLEAGGKVTGVVPKYLNLRHLIHDRLTRLDVVANMHDRKARMSELADAFIALPGGYGTFEELFETLTWAQLGLHSKPIGVLNTRHYFDPVIQLIQHALAEGFIYDEHRCLLLSDEDPGRLLEKLAQFQVPDNISRWVNRD